MAFCGSISVLVVLSLPGMEVWCDPADPAPSSSCLPWHGLISTALVPRWAPRKLHPSLGSARQQTERGRECRTQQRRETEFVFLMLCCCVCDTRPLLGVTSCSHIESAEETGSHGDGEVALGVLNSLREQTGCWKGLVLIPCF